MMLPSVTAAMTFLIKGLTSPLDVISLAINKIDGTVHLIGNKADLIGAEFKESFLAGITGGYTKPGYAPISFIGKCPKTGLFLISTTKAAMDNPHIEALGKALASAIFDKTGKILGASEIQAHTLVALGAEIDRVIYATDGTKWIQVPLQHIDGATQFTFVDGALIQGKINDTAIYGLDLIHVKSAIAGKIDVTDINEYWTQIAELGQPLTYLSRDWGKSSIVVTSGTIIEGYKIEFAADKIVMIPEIAAIDLNGAYDGIIGPTQVGTTEGQVIAMVTSPDTDGLRRAEFIPITDLPDDLSTFITSMEGISA